jgi:hypothetical protein
VNLGHRPAEPGRYRVVGVRSVLVIGALDPGSVQCSLIDCARFDARYYSAGSRTLISVLENRAEGRDTANTLLD